MNETNPAEILLVEDDQDSRSCRSRSTKPNFKNIGSGVTDRPRFNQ